MKRKYHAGIVWILISAMLSLNYCKVPVYAARSKQQVKNENKKLQEENQKIQNEIKDLDEKMTKSHETYEQCRSKLISVQKELKDTKEKLKEAKASKQEQSKIMSKRIKFLYENGNMAYMEVIFEASNFQEFLKRADYVSKISKYDSNMFLKLQTTEDTIRISQDNLKKDYKSAKELTAKAKEKKDKLDQAVLAKQKKIKAYQKKLASNKALLAQFEAEERNQEQLDMASNKEESYSNDTSKAVSQKKPSYKTEPSTSKHPAQSTSKPQTTTAKKDGTTTSSSSGHLIWPVPSCHSISSGYGYRIHPVTGVRKLHAGIDIPCSTGTSVVAAASGRVVDAGYNSYNGNYLKISHGNGLETMYLHCSKLLVSSGSKVSGGQTIARSGATGMVSGAHLHFVVKKNGNYVNPQNYL
jgi:murein DD-endopeptidase MepM/ murein hydrolase activator NlpD